MAKKTVTKTVRQYSAQPVPLADMDKLLEIAADYRTVKRYVYQRYGGIRSLSKLASSYVIQNEMTASKLRKQLGISVAYFYPAVYEAVTDLKIQWRYEKQVIARRIFGNDNFDEVDRHYLFFLLKVDSAFAAVLNCQPVKLSSSTQGHYLALSAKVDCQRLHNYLRRQVRRLHSKPCSGIGEGFAMTVDGYRYADHGIYLTTKQRRQRLFIPLTDGNRYARQLHIRLYPERHSVEIHVPIDVRVRQHDDYRAHIKVVLGTRKMLTTAEGHTYGERFGEYRQEFADWLRSEQTKYGLTRLANPGRKKYEARKRRREVRLCSYINQELNRLLRVERPAVVYVCKNHLGGRHYGYGKGGYVLRQLALKCQENDVKLVEASNTDLSREKSEG